MDGSWDTHRGGVIKVRAVTLSNAMVVHYLRVNITFVIILRHKISLAVIFWILSLGMLFSGCDKHYIKGPVNGNVTWTINGVAYKADAMAYARMRFEGIPNPPEAIISGVSYEKCTVLIELYSASAPGTYETGSGSMYPHSVLIYRNELWYRANASTSSSAVTVAVTELTGDKIKGSFEGKLARDNGELVTATGSFDLVISK